MSQTFEEFIRDWIDKNAVSPSEGGDPADLERWRQDQLIEEARAKGFYGALLREARLYGTVRDYLRCILPPAKT